MNEIQELREEIAAQTRRTDRLQNRVRAQTAVIGAFACLSLALAALTPAGAQVGVTLSSLNTRLLAVENKTADMSITTLSTTDDANNTPIRTVRFSGVNVQIVNGLRATDATPNGAGNLIVGYNEFRAGAGNDDRRGSHVVAVGEQNNYTAASYGGLLAGYQGTLSGAYTSVAGGSGNRASGDYASVAGGYNNTAGGLYASIAGGTQNIASGFAAIAAGGAQNTVSGNLSSVSGGVGNTANGDYASVAGGYLNEANGDYAALAGGTNNTANGDYSSVAGGSGNTAVNEYGSVAGGAENTATGAFASIAGGYQNTASGLYASIAGGYSNRASGFSASISGGTGNTANGSYTSISGGRDLLTGTTNYRWMAGRTASGQSTSAAYAFPF